MQISKVGYNYKNPYQNKKIAQNSQVNFEGFRIRKPRSGVIQPYTIRQDAINFINFHFSTANLKATSKIYIDDNPERNNMLLLLAQKLRNEEVRAMSSFPDAAEILGRISEVINPKNEAQRLILEDNRFSVNEFEQISKFLDKKENIKLTKNLLGIKDELGYTLDFSKTLRSILELDSAERLNKDFDKFKSYIIFNINDPDFVQNLGKELSTEQPSFNYKKLNKLFEINKKRNNSPILKSISDEILFNGNSEAIDFLSEGYVSQVLNQTRNLEPNERKFLEYFISTSNYLNVETRMEYLKQTINHINRTHNYEDITSLFKRIDADTNVQEVVDLYLEKNNSGLGQTIEPKKLMFYIDKFGAENVLRNINTFIRIIKLNQNVAPDEVADILKNSLQSRYYTTRTEIEQLKEIEKYKGRLAQIRGKLKRGIKGIFERLSGTTTPVKPFNDIKFNDYEIIPSKTEPILEVIEDKVMPNIESVVAPEEHVSKIIPLAKDAVEKTVTTQQPQVKKTIVREYKPKDSNISARKLKIFNDAQEIIKSRMKSVKQIEEQARDYSLTATKMRNKYLNELFDFVADIRKAENKNGKRHHSVSNYDVLELYQKIKGYNEKEFRKMLRARTPEGERMYSFEEINNMLDNSIIEHFKILKEQQAAAKEARQLKKMQIAATI